MNKKYADLLVNYCLNVKEGQQILVRSTSLATPLLQCLYETLLSKGAKVEHLISFENQDRIFMIPPLMMYYHLHLHFMKKQFVNLIQLFLYPHRLI